MQSEYVIIINNFKIVITYNFCMIILWLLDENKTPIKVSTNIENIQNKICFFLNKSKWSPNINYFGRAYLCDIINHKFVNRYLAKKNNTLKIQNTSKLNRGKEQLP